MARFEKGKSGNPAGKPKGARNRATVAAEALLDGVAERITQKAIELALSGDSTALKLTLERILPPRRNRPVNFELPAIKAIADLPVVTAYMAKAVSTGQLTPAEAAELARLVDAHISALTATDIEKRLHILEKKNESST